jgi:hypothetical protein
LFGHPVIGSVDLVVQEIPQRMNGLNEFLEQGGPSDTCLFVEQLLSQDRVVDGGDEVAMSLKGGAAFFQFACQPEPTVETDADGERKPGLEADVAKAEALVQEVVVEVVAACGFLARFKEALVVLAEAVGQPGFLTGEQSDTSTGEATLASECEGEGVLVDHGTVEMLDGNAFAFGLGLGFVPQDASQFLAMVGEVLAEDVLLKEIAVDAPGMIEQPRFTASIRSHPELSQRDERWCG